MKLIELLEAGEPENPSRRRFLKKAAAATAVGMTDPSALLKGAGQAAKSLAAPIAQAIASPAALEARLVAASAAWVAKNISNVELSDDSGELGLEFDDFNEWKPGENDVGYSHTDYTDPKMMVKGIEWASGLMPWGQDYGIELTPGGLPLLHTSTDGYNIGILTYMDKNGNIKTKEYEHEDYGSDIDPETGEEIGDDYGAFIDRIENGDLGGPADSSSNRSDAQPNKDDKDNQTLESKFVDATAKWAEKYIDEIELGALGDVWDPGINDVNKRGSMPWGSSYHLYTTSNGNRYLYTSTSNEDMLLTFQDKNGNMTTINLMASDLPDYDSSGKFLNYVDSIVDNYINTGHIKTKFKPGSSSDNATQNSVKSTNPIDTPATSKGISPASDVAGTVARRGIFGKIGKEILNQISKIKPTEQPPEVPTEPKADEPLQLPAPSKGEYDDLLTPEIKRMQDLAGIKRKEKD